MREFLICVAIFGCLAAGSSAKGQAQTPTTVQLPTFHFFTVQTTVSVPDSGGAYLGGMKSGLDGSLARGFGPLRNRAFGMNRGASNVSVQATIIDLKEMDDAILAEAAARRPGAAAFDADAARAELLSRHVGRTYSDQAAPASGNAGSPLPGSVAAIRAENAARSAAKTAALAAEASQYFAKAEQADAEGKPAVAKYYYQMVARRDQGELGRQALTRIASLDGRVRSERTR